MSGERPASSAPGVVAESGATAKASNRIDSAGSIDIAIEEGMPELESPVPRQARAMTPEPSSVVKAPESSAPGSTRTGETTRKGRTKLTLKIPDDEVARPNSAAPSASPPPPNVARSFPPSQAPMPVTSRAPPLGPDPSAVIVTPMRIISIGPPPPSAPVPAVTKSTAPPRPSAPIPAPGTSSPREDSWTPYQPSVADRSAVPPPVAISPAQSPARALTPAFPPPAPSASPPPVAVTPERASHHSVPPFEASSAASPATTSAIPSAPATERRLPAVMESVKRAPSAHDSSDDIPIVTEGLDSSDDIEPEPKTPPRVPIVSTPPPPPSHLAVASPAFPPSALTPAPTPVYVTPPPPVALAPKDPAVAPVGPIAPTAPRVSPVAALPQPAVDIKSLPPMRALAPTEPEALEVHFEDEPFVASPRTAESEAEIAAEDLVSVESAPNPAPGASPSTQRDTSPRAFAPVAIAGAASAGAVQKSIPPPPKPGAQAKGARVIVPTASPLAPPAMTSDHATARRKARPWWEELFNDDFIRTMAKISDDQVAGEVDFIEESLAVAKGAMLLDLACGTGRHAIELTRRGYKVVGFDLSLPMLARAAEEAQEREVKLNFVQGDMREMTFEDTFDGIYCWATSFGFFEEEKNALVVQKMHKALKKGGQLLLDVVNRDYIMRQAPSLAWFEGDGCVCMDEMSIDWITSRLKVKRTMMMDDGRTKEIDYSVRIYSLHELGKVLHEAGFRVAEVSGRTATPGVFFGSESPRTMILAEKK